MSVLLDVIVEWPDPIDVVESKPARRRPPGFDWWVLAECLDKPKPDLFAADGESTQKAAERMVWFAEDYCAHCPVLTDCRDNRGEYGLWGGVLYNGRNSKPVNLLG